MTTSAVTIHDGGHFFEAPRWHDGRLWVSDFYGYHVLSMQADGSGVRVEAKVPGEPGGLGWLPDGRLLVTSMSDHKVMRRETDGTLVVHGDLSKLATGHINDMVVDASGRAYVGNFGFDLMSGVPLETTSLHRVDPDGTVTEAADDMWFPNGSVITGDGVLIVVETFGNRVSAFDIAPDGELVNRRVWAQFGPLSASKALEDVNAAVVVAPDGTCLDAEGALWIADANNNRLVRVREGGEIVQEIALDCGVYACALGGADGRTLFACAAPDYYGEARKAAAEARILAFQVDVPGV